MDHDQGILAWTMELGRLGDACSDIVIALLLMQRQMLRVSG